ncbi:MAG: phosphonopyruvate decarboxylase [Bacilli bacterium]|nr:phosphonopyruvate decarboxylase [Bacilli bacterium]
MIDVKDFYKTLLDNDVDFFAGVPDSLLKNICAYITAYSSVERNVITANEGAAIALGAGYHLASGKVPLIYMQNSGIGNAVNPLMSLADKEVYSIPMLLLIGWRGEPGVKDEPQHIKQGRVTCSMLDSMEIPYVIIDADSNYIEVLSESIDLAKKTSAPVALLVRKDTFTSFALMNREEINLELNREQALAHILPFVPDNAVLVSTTGMLSRELFELREKNGQSHQTDFLTVGSMGHTSQIALGIALAKPEKQVFCFDGDGSAIMHMGSYAIAGSLAPNNLKLIVFNNCAHDSVGGQPTIGDSLNFSDIAHASGLKSFGTIKTAKEIEHIFPKVVNCKNTAFLEIKIKKGGRKDLGRPTSSPLQNKSMLKAFLSSK